MHYALAAALIVALAGGAGAAERLPTFKRNTPYAQARTSLQALGWKPAPVAAAERLCDGREDTCDAYPETASCAPNGAGACSMLWQREGRLIAVETIGDNDLLVRNVGCRAGC